MAVVDLEAVYASLRARIRSVWPEITSSQSIFEAEHIDLVPWTEISVPYVVIGCESVLATSEQEMDVQVYITEMDIYYTNTVQGPSSTIRPKIFALADSFFHLEDLLDGDGNYVAEILRIQGMAWSTQVPANQIFNESGFQIRTGRLTAAIRITEPTSP